MIDIWDNGDLKPPRQSSYADALENKINQNSASGRCDSFEWI